MPEKSVRFHPVKRCDQAAHNWPENHVPWAPIHFPEGHPVFFFFFGLLTKRKCNGDSLIIPTRIKLRSPARLAEQTTPPEKKNEGNYAKESRGSGRKDGFDGREQFNYLYLAQFDCLRRREQCTRSREVHVFRKSRTSLFPIHVLSFFSRFIYVLCARYISLT